MIEHVYRRAASARHVDAVIVATDDPRIADAVTRFGGDVRLTRSDHVSGTDRLAEVAARLDCDLVVNVQGDEPLIEPAAIDAAIEPFRDDAALSMSTLCTRFLESDEISNPNAVKVVSDRARLCAVFLTVAPFRIRGAAATRPYQTSRLVRAIGASFCVESRRSSPRRSNAPNRSSNCVCSKTAFRSR